MPTDFPDTTFDDDPFPAGDEKGRVSYPTNTGYELSVGDEKRRETRYRRSEPGPKTPADLYPDDELDDLGTPVVHADDILARNSVRIAGTDCYLWVNPIVHPPTGALYESATGEKVNPETHFVGNLCANRMSCVNPRHLKAMRKTKGR